MRNMILIATAAAVMIAVLVVLGLSMAAVAFEKASMQME